MAQTKEDIAVACDVMKDLFDGDQDFPINELFTLLKYLNNKRKSMDEAAIGENSQTNG